MEGFGDGKLAFLFAHLVAGIGKIENARVLIACLRTDVLADHFAKAFFTARGDGVVDLCVNDHVVTDGFRRELSLLDLGFAARVILAYAAHGTLDACGKIARHTHTSPAFDGQREDFEGRGALGLSFDILILLCINGGIVA